MWSSKLKEFENSSGIINAEINETNTNIDPQTNTVHEPGKLVNDTSYKELIGYGIGLSSMMTEILISHPFLVIRHQCQVRCRSKYSHILPFSLVPVLHSYIGNQGICTLWKGLSGVLTVKAFGIITENMLAEILPLPKDVTSHSSPKKIVLHFILKTLSWMIITPFVAAGFVEFVQSDIASEPTHLLSCSFEGFRRLFPSPAGPRLGSLAGNLKAGLKSFPIKTSRLLPLWKLVIPVALLGVSQQVIRSVVGSMITSYYLPNDEPEQIDAEAESRSHTMVNRYSPSHLSDTIVPDSENEFMLIQRQETALQSSYFRYCTDLTANMWATLASDIIVYPLETIVIRLCVQGTRTLVDNLDTGSSVLPITSSFDGPIDAFYSCFSNGFGFFSLYRGFGALIFQYFVQASFLFGVKYVYEQLLCHYSSTPASLTISGRGHVNRQTTHSISVPANCPPPEDQPIPVADKPLFSVWQPNVDNYKWRSNSPYKLEETDTPIPSADFSGLFRGYTNPL